MEPKFGEVRRLHIIYFLSHMGRIEQPHLIRLHHQTRNGVYLRDVKRWLGELRGKDMPDAFTWSYKRKYKNGYVWQDLLDDDLITPISDNEYVLKGSQINPTQFVLDYAETESLSEKETSILADEKPSQLQIAENKHQQQPSLQEKAPSQRYPDWNTDTSRQLTSEINQEPREQVFSSAGSKLTFEFDSSKVEEGKLLGTGKQNPDEQSQEEFKNYSLPLYHNLMSRKSRRQSNNYNSEKDATPDSSFSSSSSSSQSSFTKCKSYSSMFRNLITCGNVDTNDAVLIMRNGIDKNVLNKPDIKTDNMGENGKVDNLKETTRTLATPRIYHLQQQQQYSARKSCDGEKATNWKKKKQSQLANHPAYKPFGGPVCSQCGKSFKPEKMHKHMKSCKGMKSLAKSAATAAEDIQHRRSSTSSYTDSTDSACSYLLTN